MKSNHQSLAISEMQKNKILCDVILVTEDGLEISAHRNILSAWSPFFFEMFTTTNQNVKLQLKNVDPEILKLLVDYCYSSEIKITIENAEAILRNNSVVQIAKIKSLCADFLKSHINDSNCFEFRIIACLYDCEEVVSVCNSYIKDHF